MGINRIQKRLLYFLIILSCHNCKNITENPVKEDNLKCIALINDFYKRFYYDGSIYFKKDLHEVRELEKEFLSERIIKLNDTINSKELVLSYDPFIQGQDFNEESIKNTIKIYPLKGERMFKVSFILFGFKNEKRTEIDLLLEKSGDSFLISAILNDEFFSFQNQYEDSIFIEGPCENYYSKELCNQWKNEEQDKKEYLKHLKQWQGKYSFEYGRTQMREIIGAVTSFTILPEGIVKSKTTGDVLEQCIDEKGNMTGEERFLRKIDRDEIYEVIDVRQDSLKIRHTENLDEEHLLFKDKAGNYFIEGSGYFVPAPDSYYPLTKEK